MTILEIFPLTLAASAGVMTLAWLVCLATGKASVADSFWGPGFAAVSWVVYSAGPGETFRNLLLALMVSLWGCRLCLYLTLRNWNRPEDGRYRAIRENMGRGFWWKSLFKIFLVQAVLVWVVSLAAQLAQMSSGPAHPGFFDLLGVFLWVAGFGFESVADHQMMMFKKDPGNRGKVLDRGLWAYSRHPNYFGETLMWWGIYCMALQTGYGPAGLISPVVITWLLIRVSGIRITETHTRQSRPEYAEYQRKVSPFIPWFRKA